MKGADESMTDKTAKKVEKLVQAEREISINDCTHCVAIPGQNQAINIVHPFTGRMIYGEKTVAECIEENPGAVVMTLDELCKQIAERQHTPIAWDETTEEEYDYGLNVLPPAIWVRDGFMVGEPYDHDASNGQPRFQAFRQREGVYEKANRPMTRAEFRQELGVKKE